MHKPSRSDDFLEKFQRDAFGYFLNETNLDARPRRVLETGSVRVRLRGLLQDDVKLTAFARLAV